MTVIAPRRVGFLADTHSAKADGSDLPDQVLDAFAGVDLVVHLGDIGRKAILDRLLEVAPVWVPIGGNKGYIPWQTGGADESAAPVRAFESGGTAVGLAFNLAQPDKKIVVDETLGFPDEPPLAALLKRRFGRPVDVVAFGGTHTQLEQRHEGVLFFNPGSPNLPMPSAAAGVALLDLAGDEPRVEFARFSG